MNELQMGRAIELIEELLLIFKGTDVPTERCIENANSDGEKTILDGYDSEKYVPLDSDIYLWDPETAVRVRLNDTETSYMSITDACVTLGLHKKTAIDLFISLNFITKNRSNNYLPLYGGIRSGIFSWVGKETKAKSESRNIGIHVGRLRAWIRDNYEDLSEDFFGGKKY